MGGEVIYRLVIVLALAFMAFSAFGQERWGGSARAFVTEVGATTTTICAPVTEGRLFYDTNAGAAGPPDDGLLCVCGDDAAQGYVWRDVNTPTAELAGSSTSDCGT